MVHDGSPPTPGTMADLYIMTRAMQIWAMQNTVSQKRALMRGNTGVNTMTQKKVFTNQYSPTTND